MKTLSQRLISLIFTTIMVAMLLSLQVVNAAEEPEKDSSGYYLIDSVEDLKWFAGQVNDGTQTSIKGKLTEDIVFDGSEENQWTPIGNDTNMYTGTFDGQGHTISGLYFYDESTQYIGLFGYSKGTIKNVGVTGLNFKGGYSSSYVGGISGYNGGTISNCYAIGSINSSYYAGGICGANIGTVNDCYAMVGVTGGSTAYSRLGGISGTNSSQIYRCYTTGTVKFTGSVKTSFVGAVCGYNNTANTKYVYNNFYLKDTASTGMGGGQNKETMTTEVTAEQFKSGEICYLLNDNRTGTSAVWKQTIGEDDYPVLSGDTVVAYDATGGKLYGNGSVIKSAETTVTAADITNLSGVTEVKADAFENCDAEEVVVYVNDGDTTAFGNKVIKKYVVDSDSDSGVSLDTTGGSNYKFSVVVDTNKFGGAKTETDFLDEVDVIANETAVNKMIYYTENEDNDNIEFKVNFTDNPTTESKIRGQVQVKKWKDTDGDEPTGDTIYYVTKTYTVSTTGSVS